MKIKGYLDRKQLTMRQRNSIDSTRVMEIAFLNILDELMDQVIEGFCFETHRSVKHGYFKADGYALKDKKFEQIPTQNGACGSSLPSPCPLSVPDKDIFGNIVADDPRQANKAVCQYCEQPKAQNALARHLKSCKRNARSKKKENGDVSSSDGTDNSDRKKEKDVNKQQKSIVTYETMTPEETKEFLLNSCGVISKHTGRPCSKSLKCSLHSEEDRNLVRSYIFESLAPLADGNIDNDTVDL